MQRFAWFPTMQWVEIHSAGELLFSGKVEKIWKGSLDSIPSPSPSVKIQIMGGKFCLRYKGKTLLGNVNILLKNKKSVDITQQCLYLKKPSRQLFEFSLKVEDMGSNPGNLFKSFLLYKIGPHNFRIKILKTGHFEHGELGLEACLQCWTINWECQFYNILIFWYIQPKASQS